MLGELIMVKRPCLDCGSISEGSRCPAHTRARTRARDLRRGTPTQRGYDSRHYAIRARLLPRAYGQPCPRCGEPMLEGQELDLGHATPLRVDPRSRADRIEHAHCNRGAKD